MTEPMRERWLIAAWPGLGQVATTAAVYLLSKLRMQQVGEFPGRGLFEPEGAEITGGLVRSARLPRSRLFLWRPAAGGPDIIVFLGEAQPATGKLALCERLLSAGRSLGVRRFFTFSALATETVPGGPSRIFGVASDAGGLNDLKRHGVEVISEGTISGLNGVALAAASEAGIPAIGLLGEIPMIASQSIYPNASAAVLRAFKDLAGLDLDLSELEEYGTSMQGQFSQLYDQLKEALREIAPPGEPAEAPAPPPFEAPSEPKPADEDAERIERLFRRARLDRSAAFMLKNELDRLGLFSRYEDRFLDLFEHGHGA